MENMEQKRNYIYTERAHLMCPDMHFGIVAKLNGAYQAEKVRAGLTALQQAHPFLRSVIGTEVCTEKLYYQYKSDLQIPVTVAEEEEENWWQEAFTKISRRGWDVRREAMLQVFVHPTGGEFNILMIAHHLLCDGRGLLQLVQEFAEYYIKGTKPETVEECVIRSVEDLPAGSDLPFISRLVVKDANKKWAKEKQQVSYDSYASFERSYGAGHPVERIIQGVPGEDMIQIKKQCKKQGVSVNDYLIATMMQKEDTNKVVIAVDIRNQVSCYRQGAMGNYATAFGVTVKKKESNLYDLARQVKAEVEKIRKQPSREMLVLSCYLQMTPELIDAVAISTLGTYQSKAARFVGDHMFGYGSQEGYSITNLGRIESDVIAEASFIPPASPANRKTQGILTVNGKMAICSAIRK